MPSKFHKYNGGKGASVILVAGLGFGDEGKGSIVDFLCRTAESTPLVVRYNGGSQAAHAVVSSDGREHIFAQFGSGTLAGAKTHLSKYMLVNPIFMVAEAKHLENECGIESPLSLVSIHEDALITNPFQVALSRLKEINRGKGRHGSCGMGINETVVDGLSLGPDAIIARDLKDPEGLRRKLELSQEAKLAEVEALNDLPRMGHARVEMSVLKDRNVIDAAIEMYTQVAREARITTDDWLLGRLKSNDTVIFEGAQGVLLDQNHGFFPHVTRANTTFENAYDLLDVVDVDLRRIGVTRTYMTRHGAGPFPTEDKALSFRGEHNVWGPWQEGFRYGHLDLALLQYALEAIKGVDELALTCIDHLPGERKVCLGYHDFDLPPPEYAESEAAQLEQQQKLADQLFSATPKLVTQTGVPSDLLGVPITIRSVGPTADDKFEA